jgi:hypothetical protein
MPLAARSLRGSTPETDCEKTFLSNATWNQAADDSVQRHKGVQPYRVVLGEVRRKLRNEARMGLLASTRLMTSWTGAPLCCTQTRR